MKAVFLGTGTSVGIPVIGCDCPVCRSTDPRNRRRRTSLHVEVGGTHLVVDTPPDFREQALQYRVPRVDAVLFTHSHADHIFGFDDIRRYNTLQDGTIPAYASANTTADLHRVFDYILRGEEVPGVYRPRIDFIAVSGPFRVGPCDVTPLAVEHGTTATFGYVFRAGRGSLGYFPDCHRMSDDVVGALRGIDVMILDALRPRPHATHLSVPESVALLQRIGAGRSYLVHMGHDVDHEAVERTLPASIRLAYDGLGVDL